jgi:DNA-binding transcriptional LysR family regulator
LIEFDSITSVHLARIDLNLFVVFDAIYAEGGITRAGKRLNLSQPAISHALARLRETFDDPLFVRRKRAMTPTPLARQIVEPIRQSLQRFEATLTKVDRFDPKTASKRFTIGIRDASEAALLPTLLGKIARAAPGIDIAVVKAERRELQRELAAGTLDAAVDIALPLADEIKRQRLAVERSMVVARKRHPRVRPGLTLKTYMAEEHIVVSQRRQGLTFEDFELGRLNLRRRVRLRCQHYYAACRTVSETDLVLTMSERYARILNEHFGNQLMPFPLKAPVYDTYIYWHTDADNDPASKWLREQLLLILRRG